MNMILSFYWSIYTIYYNVQTNNIYLTIKVVIQYFINFFLTLSYQTLSFCNNAGIVRNINLISPQKE